MEIIAYIHSPLKEKFGTPKQSNLAKSVKSRIVMEPKYRIKEAFRGLEGYDYIWLLWQFSEVPKDKEGDGFTATVRPPALGGNARMGVFATRSPFRPNRIGLSSVRLEGIEWEGEEAPVLLVSGADLMDKTPILDIKPYLPFTDSHPEARGGFSPESEEKRHAPRLQVIGELPASMSEEEREALWQCLSLDPRPAYHEDPGRLYGMEFGRYEVRFFVEGECARILEIKEKTPEG